MFSVLELSCALRTSIGVSMPVALRILAVSWVRLPAQPCRQLLVHPACPLTCVSGSQDKTSFWQEGVPRTEEVEPREDVAALSLVASDSSTSAWVLKVTKVQEARMESHP